MQTDPVGYADQMNLYAYVYNDPLNATDPTGKWGRYMNPQTLINLRGYMARSHASQLTRSIPKPSGVEVMRAGAVVADYGSTACLTAAAVTLPNPKVSVPAAGASAILGGVSIALDVTADLVEGIQIDGGDVAASISKAGSGNAAEYALRAANVPKPVAQAIGVGVSAVVEIADVASDVAESANRCNQNPSC